MLGYGLCGSGGVMFVVSADVWVPLRACRGVLVAPRPPGPLSVSVRCGRGPEGRGLVVAIIHHASTSHQTRQFIGIHPIAAARPKLLMPKPAAKRHRRSHASTENTLKGRRPTAPSGAWRPLAVVSTPQPARPGEPPRWGRHQQHFMSSRRRLSEPSCGRHEAAAGASSAGHRPLGRRPAPGCAGPAPTARPPTSWRCLPPRSAHP